MSSFKIRAVRLVKVLGKAVLSMDDNSGIINKTLFLEINNDNDE